MPDLATSWPGFTATEKAPPRTPPCTRNIGSSRALSPTRSQRRSTAKTTSDHRPRSRPSWEGSGPRRIEKTRRLEHGRREAVRDASRLHLHRSLHDEVEEQRVGIEHAVAEASLVSGQVALANELARADHRIDRGQRVVRTIERAPAAVHLGQRRDVGKQRANVSPFAEKPQEKIEARNARAAGAAIQILVV